MTKGVIASVVAAILFVVGQFLLERYLKLEVVTNFNTYEIYTSYKINKTKGPKQKFIELVIDNESDAQQTVSDIKVFGISELYSSYTVLTNATNAGKNEKFVSKNKGEYFYLKDEYLLQKNGTVKLYLHADFDGGIFSTVKIGRDIQSFDKMVYVYGVKKFFSSNWEYLATFIFFMFVLLIYVYQAKNTKNI